MGDGVFRSKKGFTAVGNQVVRDREISFKAKGLYMLIQSYITMPDVVWKKADFENMALEGTKAFDSAWNELKEAGYLKVHIFPNSSKKSRFSSEFELLDEPQKGVHTFYYNAKGVVTATNVTKNEKKRVGEKEDNLRYHQNGGNENDNVEKGVNERMDNNNKIDVGVKRSNSHKLCQLFLVFKQLSSKYLLKAQFFRCSQKKFFVQFTNN